MRHDPRRLMGALVEHLDRTRLASPDEELVVVFDIHGRRAPEPRRARGDRRPTLSGEGP
jgi:hypothetical protein